MRDGEGKRKVLFSATVARHIIKFHIPYLKWFKEQGWETWVAAKNENSDESCDIPYCDHFVNIDFARSPFSKNTFIAYRQLRHLLFRESFDIVHAHTPVGGVLTRFAARNARKNGTKVVYTAHGFHFYRGAPLRNWILWYPVERFMARFTDVLITINREDYSLAHSFSRCDVEYVPGVGVELDRFENVGMRGYIRQSLGFGSSDFIILSVGDLIPRKNQALIVKALDLLPEECKLCICGEGPERERLEEITLELCVDKRVHFLGYRNDIPVVMAASDCLAFPSIHEGLPVSVIEAMAAGLPVIASSIRGINPDLICNDENGLLLGANTPEEMAQCICFYMNNRGATEKIAARAREDVRKFDVDNLLKYMAEIYRSTGVFN